MLSLSRLRCYSNITDEFELRIQSGCQTTDQLKHDHKKVPQLAASKGVSEVASENLKLPRKTQVLLRFARVQRFAATGRFSTLEARWL